MEVRREEEFGNRRYIISPADAILQPGFFTPSWKGVFVQDEHL